MCVLTGGVDGATPGAVVRLAGSADSGTSRPQSDVAATPTAAQRSHDRLHSAV